MSYPGGGGGDIFPGSMRGRRGSPVKDAPHTILRMYGAGKDHFKIQKIRVFTEASDSTTLPDLLEGGF